jgi:hypothetical protein
LSVGEWGWVEGMCRRDGRNNRKGGGMDSSMSFPIFYCQQTSLHGDGHGHLMLRALSTVAGALQIK